MFKENLFIFNKKRAWVKIVEAFIAILILAGVLISLISFNSISKDDFSNEIYNVELSLLHSIQNNQTYRNFLLNDSLILPIELYQGNKDLQKIDNYLLENSPFYLNCSTFLCDMGNNCVLNKKIDKSIFSQSIIVSSNLTNYNPRKLKVFCWINN